MADSKVRVQAPRDAARADGATLAAQREAITPDATNGSGPRPDTFDLSTADVRSQLEGAGVRPEVRKLYCMFMLEVRITRVRESIHASLMKCNLDPALKHPTRVRSEQTDARTVRLEQWHVLGPGRDRCSLLSTVTEAL